MLLGFFGLRARNCSSSLLIRIQFLFKLPFLHEGFESAPAFFHVARTDGAIDDSPRSQKIAAHY
jgi:hypothetical protein